MRLKLAGCVKSCDWRQLSSDVRFELDDVTFDDRVAKSEATESTIPANFTPSK